MPLCLQIYLEFMISVAMTMGATEERAVKDMKEVQEFEIQLANISTLSGDIVAIRYIHFRN